MLSMGQVAQRGGGESQDRRGFRDSGEFCREGEIVVRGAMIEAGRVEIGRVLPASLPEVIS